LPLALRLVEWIFPESSQSETHDKDERAIHVGIGNIIGGGNRRAGRAAWIKRTAIYKASDFARGGHAVIHFGIDALRLRSKQYGAIGNGADCLLAEYQYISVG
jgi:hypothetical protein